MASPSIHMYLTTHRHIYIYIYILFKYLNPATAWSSRINVKEREERKTSEKVKKKNGIEALRMKHSTLSRATDALIGDREQNRKQKRTRRKKERERERIDCSGFVADTFS